jgi:hypothetical protein
MPIKFSKISHAEWHLLLVAVGFKTTHRQQPASITARYTHRNCVRVVPPEDGQVMLETCRGFEF